MSNIIQFPKKYDDFSQDQVELIAKSHSETIQKVFDFHSAQMAYAAHCIIVLLAREQLNGVR